MRSLQCNEFAWLTTNGGSETMCKSVLQCLHYTPMTVHSCELSSVDRKFAYVVSIIISCGWKMPPTLGPARTIVGEGRPSSSSTREVGRSQRRDEGILFCYSIISVIAINTYKYVQFGPTKNFSHNNIILIFHKLVTTSAHEQFSFHRA